jgi:hypothetical protein
MLRLTLRTAAMAPLIIVAALTFGAHTAAAQGQVPAMIAGVPNERDNQDLFDHADQWPTARRYVGRIIHADHSLDQVSDAQLAGWLTQLKSWGMGLELEVGVIKAWAKDSHDAFDKDDRNWQRVIRLGGTISSIAMDEPLGAARADHRISLSDQQAVEETAQFIELVRQHYPAVQIGDIEPYPLISPDASRWWLAALQNRLASAHVRGLDFYRIDPDWIEFRVLGSGSWRDLLLVQKYCNSNKLPFSLIYWASDYPRLSHMHLADDEEWYTSVMSEGYAYAEVGGAPDQFVLESWIPAPSRIVPDDGNFTFTRAVADFGKKFLRRPGATP